MDEHIARQKKESLKQSLEVLHSLIVAFSGGVDSSFLLALSHQVLGEKVIAVTADSLTFTQREKEEAVRFTKERGIRHIIIQSTETNIPEFVFNQPDRCYHCKKSLAKNLLKLASEKGIKHIAFAANMDDLGDYRPGMKATSELGVLSPLIDVRLNKEEIRFLSREMGLSSWDKPAMACLASRIPYGIPITEEKLKMIALAEAFLFEQGLKQCRVRYHDSVARIEVEPSKIHRLVEVSFRKEVVKRFREIGFAHVSVDLEGYVSGSMNRVLKEEDYHES